ncbi:unnamed protein product [Agarophyton chilense]
MSSADFQCEHEELLTVKDYRPSLRSSSSSDISRSSDEEFSYEVEKPCPFAGIPRKSKLGKMYLTRYRRGLWEERPIITTVETPFKLRFWTIMGPNEVYDDDEGQGVGTGETLIIPTTGLGPFCFQPQGLHLAPRPKGSVGKMSPLQRSYMKRAPPPRSEHPNQYHGVSLSCARPPALGVTEMLNTDARCVEEPCGLSDSSSNSDSHNSLTYFPSLSSSNSTSKINFCLDSNTDDDSCGEDTQPNFQLARKGEAAFSNLSNRQNLKLRQSGKDADAKLLQSSTASLTQTQAHIQSLTNRVEQLMSLANSLQDKLTCCDKENTQLQHQVQAWQTLQSSSEECTFTKSSADQSFPVADSGEELERKRPSLRTNLFATEEERLRMELMEQGQKTAEVLLENEMLLGVILKLKCELDLEHTMYEKLQNAIALQPAGMWQRLKRLVISPNGSTDSKKNQRGWLFARSKSRKLERIGS